MNSLQLFSSQGLFCNRLLLPTCLEKHVCFELLQYILLLSAGFVCMRYLKTGQRTAVSLTSLCKLLFPEVLWISNRLLGLVHIFAYTHRTDKEKDSAAGLHPGHKLDFGSPGKVLSVNLQLCALPCTLLRSWAAHVCNFPPTLFCKTSRSDNMVDASDSRNTHGGTRIPLKAPAGRKAATPSTALAAQGPCNREIFAVLDDYIASAVWL